jgi:energy-coupling factor transporter ATP-binding protein EcfA2
MLERVAVSGLLGQFDHVVDFPQSFKFIVLHGPNGVGKTKLLELINATFSADFASVSETPFSCIDFNFSDGCKLTVTKPGQQVLPGLDLNEDISDRKLSISLRDTEGERQEWESETDYLDLNSPKARRLIERDFGLSYVGRNRWRGLNGGIVSSADIPRSIFRRMTTDQGNWEGTPEWLLEFISSTRVHLIETQRLVQSSRRHFKNAEGEGKHRRDTVSEFAEALSGSISETLARNSRTSQKLDRTFPRRVLRKTPLPPEVTDELIREKYEEQSRIREELEEIAILENQDDIPLPDGDLEGWERRVLWAYLNDSAEKLGTFETLLARVRLLIEIVNSRFINKQMVIDRDRGFVFMTSVGREITAAQLSSGEQHELVLVYDLLFNVKESSLVLIDEPEISLHIAWQQKFLSDIERIAKLAGHRFIIATHSPQIVHKRWSQTVSLGSVGVDEN